MSCDLQRQNDQLRQCLRGLQKQFDDLRKEKIQVESGKRQLISENEQMKAELAELRESVRLKQLRIQRLE